jgi:hypothetical protein
MLEYATSTSRLIGLLVQDEWRLCNMVFSEMSDDAPKSSIPVLLIRTSASGVTQCIGPELSDESRRDLGDAIKNGVRTAKNRRRFRAALEKHGLVGCAVVIHTDELSKSAIPPPLAVHFEPMELNERDPALEALCHDAPTTIRRRRRMPRAAVGKRLLMRIGIPVAAAVLVAPYLTCDVASSGVGLKGYLLTIPLVALAAIAGVFLLRWRTPKWFLVPGGVIIKEYVWGSLERRLRRCTPENATLLVRPGFVAWVAVIFHGERLYDCELTDLECATLLAAWQSPISAPDVKNLCALL